MEVLAFGEVMMRLMVTQKKTMVQGDTLEYMFTGTGVNILGAMGRMGHGTRLLTKLSTDSLGDSARSRIMALGIDVSCIARGEGYTGMYFLEEGFGYRASKVTYNNRRESAFSLSREEDYDLEKALDGVELLHFCGISLAMSEELRGFIYSLGERAKRMGIKVAFDFNYRPAMWRSPEEARVHYERILELADLVFATERDARYILGLESGCGEREDEIEDLLSQMAKKYALEGIAGTIRKRETPEKQSLRGFIVGEGGAVFSKEYEFQVYDRIGGGDGFAAGILHSYLRGYPLEKGVEFATVSGILAHTNYGDTPVSTLEDIEEILEGRMSEIKR